MKYAFKAVGIWVVIRLFDGLNRDFEKKIKAIKIITMINTEEVIVTLTANKISTERLKAYINEYVGNKLMLQTLHIIHGDEKTFKHLPKKIKEHGKTYELYTPDAEEKGIDKQREELEQQGYLTIVANVNARKEKKPDQRIYKLKF